MGDEDTPGGEPDRVSAGTPPIGVPGTAGYIPPVTLSMDDVYNSQAPSSLTAGPGGKDTQAEWNDETFDAAITGLKAYAEFLSKMYYGMDDIKDLMGGPNGGMVSSPLGGFDWAMELAKSHTTLLDGTKTNLKNATEALYDAADAVNKIKEHYKTVEDASAMSAADMEKAFSDQASSTHDF